MKLSEVFPSNFLKSDDLQGRDAQVVISGADMEMVGNDRKLVLTFQGKKKAMICNKTNANRIAFLYGEDTDGWIGKEIVLFSEFVEFQGKTVKGLRVKPPQEPTSRQPRANGKPPQRQHVIEQRGNYALSSTKAVQQSDGLEEVLGDEPGTDIGATF